MKKNIIILLVILIVFLIAWIIFYDKKINIDKTNQKENIVVTTKTVSGNSMYPMLSNWEKINLMEWYYNNKEVELWDLVSYNYAWKYEYIKIVKATSKEKVEIIWSNLYINWEIMKNSESEIYEFTENEIKLLSLYISNNKIPEWSFFIFWDNVKESTDSRKFWAISKQDLFWKFEILQNRNF